MIAINFGKTAMTQHKINRAFVIAGISEMPQTRRHIWRNVAASVPEEVIRGMTANQIAGIIAAANKSYHDGRASNGGAEIVDDAVWIGRGIDKLVPLEALKKLEITEQIEYELRPAGIPAPDGRTYYLADGKRVDYSTAEYERLEFGATIYVAERTHTTRYSLQHMDAPAPRGPGRPAELAGGKRVNVYLDALSLEHASKLGGGNVSEGIRTALHLSTLTITIPPPMMSYDKEA